MFQSRTFVRALAGGLPLISLVGLTIVLSSHGAASSAEEFRLRDDCDPATFNAAIRPGACVGNGGTTFAKFIQELTEDKSVGAWRISPDNTGLDAGQPTLLVSRGGELHTFTRVQKFGGGIVPFLNDLAGLPQVAQECQDLHGNPTAVTAASTPVFPGAAVKGPAIPVGTTHFQCCIHPWMRTTVEVKSHH